ncbi:MAG: D-aminoacyl-tRNA deacylase, partial [Methanothrix sp.]|nr:D-aminoacyl-tRNA deacylase [Methanothrix sp.]
MWARRYEQEMMDEVAVICSSSDPASLNIYERLLELEHWEEHDGFRRSGNKCLIIHDEEQSALRGFDAHLNGLGLHLRIVVFACRHESKAGLPWFGGHFTGVIEKFRREVSCASPAGLRSFLCNIRNFAPQRFQVSAEATHHGPTDMRTPCFFAEIGSTMAEWCDVHAGEAAARAILALELRELPVFLGFGGGHYVQRQTDLMLKADIAFGHLFSSYNASWLDAKLVRDASQKSGASFAYIDRKSLRSADRLRI